MTEPTPPPMNSYFVVCDNDGNIWRSGYCPTADMLLQAHQPDETILASPEPVNGASNYVINPDSVNPEFGVKEPMNVTVQGNTISGLPNPCRVASDFDGSVNIVTDGEVVVDADAPGDYRFHLASTKFISEFVTVHIP